jgi:hypothetical protein
MCKGWTQGDEPVPWNGSRYVIIQSKTAVYYETKQNKMCAWTKDNEELSYPKILLLLAGQRKKMTDKDSRDII